MEINPNMPRQRNRRTERLAEQPADSTQFVQPVPTYQPMPPVQKVIPPQTVYQQPVVQSSPPPIQPVRPQAQPRVMSQPRVVVPQQMYPPQQGGYPPYPQQQMAPNQTVQYAPRTQAAAQPTEVPHARARYGLTPERLKAARIAERESAAKIQREISETTVLQFHRTKKEKTEDKAAPPRKKVSGWVTTALSLCIVAIMGLIAAYYLMQAYLVQEEEARAAAYRAVLSNHHVTEQADGTMRVTWQDEIEKYAAQYNLQPAFVTAIIRNESSFRTGAESSVGARGLMQLMPDTAEWIAGKLDDDSYHFDRMWDGETNIRYGCWYLGYLSRLFHGDAMLVCAAYHAGQTAVTQWLSDPDKSDDGVSLNYDALLEGPTKQYIGRVTQSYGTYQSLLYPDEAFVTKDTAVPSRSGFSITIER